MASIKIVLRKKQHPNGTFPLALRITTDRKSSFIHTGHSVKLQEWDSKEQRVKKNHPNSVRLNNLLLKKLSEANKGLLDLEITKDHVSSKAIKQVIQPTSEATFFGQAKLYLSNLKQSGKYNRLSAEQPRVNRFKEFLKDEDIHFKDITVSLLKNFQAFLRGTRTIKERTVVNHLVVIRSICNQAIKGNLVDPKYYPFGANKIRIKFPDSVKIGLTADEVKQLEDVQLDHAPNLNHTRNLWLFSYYFAGIRVSDVLRIKWSDFQDNRLYYTMGKNLKADSLKIPTKALGILEQYAPTETSPFVFPDLHSMHEHTPSFEMQKKINVVVKRLDENLQKIAALAGISKKLTMHISRHTFGNISGERIPLQLLQKLYRHSSITTTIGYQQNFIHKDVDMALEAVIGM